MEEVVTPERAQEVFGAMAQRCEEIAFRWLLEGCECRAQLMIEHMLAMGVHPGRAWAMSVGRRLRVPHPDHPGEYYKWENHVAPTLAVQGEEYGVLVINPSLSRTGPHTLAGWAAAMSARSFEVSPVGLPQTAILARQTARTLAARDLDAVLFVLELGEPPILDAGGSGFVIGPDPPAGVGAYAHEWMKVYLMRQAKMPPGHT